MYPDHFLASTVRRLSGLQANFILISGHGSGQVHEAYRLSSSRYLLMLSRDCLRFRHSHGGSHEFYYETVGAETARRLYPFSSLSDGLMDCRELAHDMGVACCEGALSPEINLAIELSGNIQRGEWDRRTSNFAQAIVEKASGKFKNRRRKCFFRRNLDLLQWNG